MKAHGGSVRVDAGPLILGMEKSGSIAVNGCCLTAIDITGTTFAADLSGETLRRTSLGKLKPGTRVNLERPLTAEKELGGHFVQGHVDGVGEVVARHPTPDWEIVTVGLPPGLSRYVVEKGSVAVDGVSLTVTAVGETQTLF